MDPHPIPSGEQQGHHDGVLLADLSRQFRQHPGGHPKVDPEIQDMSHPHTANCDYQYLLLPGEFPYLLHQGQDHIFAVVHNPVPPHLHHVQFWDQSNLIYIIKRAKQALPDQGFSLQPVRKLKPFASLSMHDSFIS